MRGRKICIYWYDYINPYRFIQKIIRKKQVISEAGKLLPAPYKTDQIYCVLRMQDDVPYYEMATDLDAKENFETWEKLKIDINKRFQQISPAIEALAAAIPYIVDTHEYLSAIDNHVYETMENLTGNNIDTFADLSRSVKESFKNAQGFWDKFGENSIHKFGGHLGEVYVGEHLKQAGQDVVFPEMSNNPGFDLVLNGHQINVKTIKDAYQLSAHFDEYPDIPVIIPHDADHIPDGAIQFNPSYGIDDVLDALNSKASHLVFVDDALSHTNVMEQAENFLDIAANKADCIENIGGGFPFPSFNWFVIRYKRSRVVA